MIQAALNAAQATSENANEAASQAAGELERRQPWWAPPDNGWDPCRNSCMESGSTSKPRRPRPGRLRYVAIGDSAVRAVPPVPTGHTIWGARMAKPGRTTVFSVCCVFLPENPKSVYDKQF